MTTPEPTIRDIYYKLGGLESKIDSVLALQNAANAEHSRRLDDLDDKTNNLDRRTSRLEQIEAKRAGMFMIIAGLFSLVSAAIVKSVSSLFHIG